MVHRGPGHPPVNALRLCLGTFTLLPVRRPASVDGPTAGHAMVLAPLAGALLAVVAGAGLWLLGEATSSLLSSTLTVALLAVTTRGLHLDGLADVADGLGSGRPAEKALDVMRRSDIGPFGVASLLLVLLVQIGALSTLPAHSAVAALVVAIVVSRSVVPLLCLRGVAAARPEGLGRLVAGTVSPLGALAAVLIAAAVCLVVGLGLRGDGGSTYDGLRIAAAGVAGVAAGCTFGWHCVRRFGGITGDVLGACIEVAFTAAMLVPAFH